MTTALTARRAVLAPGPWVKNELWRRARAVPSLDLRFAESKSLVDATTGASLVTFTRASSGTYVDSQGVIKTAATNEARFDHNPTTGESLGLLVEEQRTNLFQYSEEIDNAYWSITNANGTISVNQATAPDGNTTADLYQEDTAGPVGRAVSRSISFTAGTTYAISVWAKQAPGATRYFGLLFPTGAFGSNVLAAFTLSGAGSVNITTPGTGTSAQIQAYTNGWYRCTLISQATVTTASSPQLRISNSSTNGGASYTGDGTSGIYIWGAQLEVGSFPTSYIPTTTAAVTRSADVASISGSNFSSWYRQDEGAVFADVTRPPAVSGRYPSIVNINNGTSSNRIQIYCLDYALRYTHEITTGGVSQVPFNQSPSVAANSFNKLAVSLKFNDTAFAADSTVVNTDGSVTLPTVSQLDLTGIDTRTIRRLTYWPARLANSTLQAITQ